MLWAEPPTRLPVSRHRASRVEVCLHHRQPPEVTGVDAVRGLHPAFRYARLFSITCCNQMGKPYVHFSKRLSKVRYTHGITHLIEPCWFWHHQLSYARMA